MTTVTGLPAHPLLVHAAVVLVPLAALLVLLHACVPAARARLGLVTPVVAVLALGAAKLAESAGESFEKVVRTRPGTDLAALHRHAELGEAAVLWAAAVAVVGVAVWALHDPRLAGVRERLRVPDARWVRLVGAVAAVVVLVGGVYATVTAGHSGAALTWSSFRN